MQSSVSLKIQRVADHARFAGQLIYGTYSRGQQQVARRRLNDISPYMDTGDSLDVLDLANGRLRPQYFILKASGHKVYGIDLVNKPDRGLKDIPHRLARWLFMRTGEELPSSLKCDTLVCGDVSTLPFPDNTFDLVTSVAAFEHFPNVPAVVKELHRVLKPGGIAWVAIHLFTSLSGGHNLSLTQIPILKLPKKVAPWDHLRQRELPFHVFLNEWRSDWYLKTFGDHFELQKVYYYMPEGEQFLSPEIEAELSTYTRDELLHRNIIVVARKPYA